METPIRSKIPRITLAVAALAMTFGAISSTIATFDPIANALNAGCDSSRPAVAHHAGGVVLAPQPPGAPVPCYSFAGPSTDDAAIGVTDDGDVFFAPVSQLQPNPVPAPANAVTSTAVARSTNGGATWTDEIPGPAGAFSPHGSLIDWLSVDPTTSRVWYATPTLPCGATVSWSDDSGATWQTTPNIGCPAMGGNVLIEGPAPAGAAKPTGIYPHVVYYCALAEDFTAQGFLDCHKSLDGGTTWVNTATPDNPLSGACSTPTRATLSGIVGSNGFLYFPKVEGCSGSTSGTGIDLNISGDEGSTWSATSILRTTVKNIYPPAIAQDEAGNLYIAWTGGDSLPYMIVSTDNGLSWSNPMEVAAPSVTDISGMALTARHMGQVSISYLGSTDNATTFNAYITETTDATGSNPTFWSASINDPAQGPVAKSSTSTTFGNRLWFMTGMIGPDGTPWAGFHCAYTTLCPNGRVGMAARLMPAS